MFKKAKRILDELNFEDDFTYQLDNEFVEELMENYNLSLAGNIKSNSIELVVNGFTHRFYLETNKEVPKWVCEPLFDLNLKKVRVFHVTDDMLYGWNTHMNLSEKLVQKYKGYNILLTNEDVRKRKVKNDSWCYMMTAFLINC